MNGMRRHLAVVSLLVTAYGCTGDGGGVLGSGNDDATCRLVERLAATAQTVEQADISDPDAFEAALDVAVLEYSATVDDLLDVAPKSLRDDLERMKAAVEQYRFEDAITARAALDDYTARACDFAATTTSGAAPNS